ncbi:YdcF family protein [uncultured Vagococcus sp.]|uniref:YdcF family protein n=1 Tax=uncultured Vagococcus sp. TaxID=189676 RepID=UPI0028D1FFB4|nr:YdcF family protein [uncultured Vagococcus sp.]
MLVSLTLFIVIPTLLFCYWMYQKPTSLLTGFFFLYFIGSLSAIIVLTLERVNQNLALLAGIALAIPLMLFALFGIYAMIIALFWNERILLKHERRSLANMLPLIIATGLMLFELILLVVTTKVNNAFILKLFAFLNVSFTYFAMTFILFGLTAILYNLYPITYKVDYIIVLGAGLNKDKVTPLLAARIDAGIQLYMKQVAKLAHHPTIILSGGQGVDETISEAQAMKHYIDEQGYQVKTIYLEDKSTNTRENLLFSERIASSNDQITGLTNKNVVIATNNYHLLRAGKLAKQLDIKARGVGAKTRFYYLPTGFIREYIGYLVMTKKKHLTVIAVLFGLSLLPLLFDLILNL